MHRRRALLLGCCVLLALTAGCAAYQDSTPTDQPSLNNSTYDRPITPPDSADSANYSARVDLYNDSERHATIYAETATNGSERYTGLSEHESLEPWEGMLFVYPFERDLTFVMRNMSFGIDIVYIDENACITTAHAAPEPGPDEDGEAQRYPGTGQYVLEVPIGVVTDSEVGAGDPVRIQYDDVTVDGRGNCSGTSEG